MLCQMMALPAIGNSGFGMSSDNGRMRVPVTIHVSTSNMTYWNIHRNPPLEGPPINRIALLVCDIVIVR